MSHALKVDERAFNEGVKEVLRLKPIVRMVKTVVRDLKDEPKKQDKARPVVKR